MLRFLRLFLVIKLLLMIGGLSYLWVTRVAKTEEFLSKKLGATVTLKEVSFGLKSFKVKNLQVSAPSFSKLPLFKAEEVEVEMPMWELLKDDVLVSEVKIFNPILGIHYLNRTGSENNWSESLKRDHAGIDKRFTIESLKVMNLQFAASLPGGRNIQLPPLPYFELRNLKSQTIVELEKSVLEGMAAKEEALSTLFTDLTLGTQTVENNESSLVKKALNRVKGLF